MTPGSGFRRALLVSLSILSFACSTSAVGDQKATEPAADGVVSVADADGFITCGRPSGPVCPAGLDCLGGLCLAKTDATCTLSDKGTDGCDAQSTCAAGPDGPRCYVAPPCAGGRCPLGSVCNDGTLSTKDAVCIPDRCMRDADCIPSVLSDVNKRCVRRKTTDLIGHCDTSSSYVSSVGAYGNAHEATNGCPTEPFDLGGTKPAGAACDSPFECKPVCCACQGGSAMSLLAAMCDFNTAAVVGGNCASADEACKRAPLSGTCTAP